MAQAAACFPHRWVIGEAGVLNTASGAHDQRAVGVSPADRVEGIGLGSHGRTVLAIPSLTAVDGTPLPETLSDSEMAAIVVNRQGGGGCRLGDPGHEGLSGLLLGVPAAFGSDGARGRRATDGPERAGRGRRGAARRMIIDARENVMEATALCVADRAAHSSAASAGVLRQHRCHA